jgi:uncharacterized protein
MLSEPDRRAIQDISRKYHATRVILFGSSLSSPGEAHDIDLAVEGISGKDFYEFYGELMCTLSRPVDVVDLSQKSKFVQLILKEGEALYG